MPSHRFKGALVSDVAPDLGAEPTPLLVAHEAAMRLFEPGLVSDVTPPGHNFVRSFAVFPSGSGIGREAELGHGKALDELANYLRAQNIKFVIVENDESTGGDWQITQAEA